MSSNSNAQAASEEVQNLNNKKFKQQKDIERLKNDNSTKLEQLSRNKERIKSLDQELKQRKDQLEKLKLNLKKTNPDGNFNEEEHIEFSKKDKPVIDPEEQKVKIIEKLNNRLDKYNKDFETKYKEYNDDKKGEVEDDEFERMLRRKTIFKTLCIKYIHDEGFVVNEPAYKEKIISNREFDKVYKMNIRYSKTTDFLKIKNLACSFWKLPPAERIYGLLNDEKRTFSNFEITDENFCQIPEDINVEMFFRQRAAAEYNQALILLKMKNLKQETLNSAQEDSINLQKNQNKRNTAARGKNDDVSVKIKKQEEIDVYEEFFKKFPGMKYYINPQKVRDFNDESQKENFGFQLDDYSCCVSFWYLIMLIFTLLSITTYGSMNSVYYNIKSLKSGFGFESFTANAQKFGKIRVFDEYIEFLNTSIADSLFDDLSILRKQNYIIGSIQIRQVRTKAKEKCDRQMGNSEVKTCYYLAYDDSTKYKENIKSTKMKDWMLYKTAEENNVTSIVIGEFSTYDGSGFSVNFYNYTSKADFSNKLAELKTEGFWAINTRAIFFTFTLYNPNLNYWTNIQMVLEFTIAGFAYPNPIKITPFRVNIYNNELEGRSFLIYEVIRIILAAFLLIFMIYRMVLLRKQNEFFLKYLNNVPAILNLVIFILTICSCAVSIVYCYKTYDVKTQILEDNISFMDFVNLAYGYSLGYEIQAICFAGLVLRIVLILKLNKGFNIILSTFEKAGVEILIYSIILIPILVGFCFVGMNIWGPYVKDFSTFPRAFLTIVMLTIGKIDSDQLLKINFLWSLFFLVFFYFVIVFFLMSVFLGIFIDSYRLVIMDLGYNWDKSGAWKFKDYIHWLCAWLPNNMIHKLGIKIKSEEDEKTTDNKNNSNLNEDKEDKKNLIQKPK